VTKTLLSIATLVLISFYPLTVATAQNISKTVEKVLDSTVTLDLKNAEGKRLKDSIGFFLTRDLVVTNIHVVENAVSGYVQLVKKRRKFKIEGITRNDEYSLALLKVRASGVQPLVLGDSDVVQYGDTIYTVGNPLESEVRFSRGMMRGRDVESISVIGKDNIIIVGDRVITGSYSGNAEWLRISLPISREISGGPVLNGAGGIIGVATHRGRSGWQPGNFAVSSKTVKSLLDKVVVEPIQLQPSSRATSSRNKFLSPFEKVYRVNPDGCLTVDLDIGRIDIRTAEGNRIEIVVTKEAKIRSDQLVQEALADFKVTSDQTGSDVAIEGKFQRGRNYWQKRLNQLRIRFQVTVPRQYNVDLNTLRNDIFVDGLAGKVQAQTSAGDVRINNIVGAVETHTSAGNLRFGSIMGPILGRSSAGDITLSNCQDAVDTKTSAGDIQADITTQLQHEWSLRTSAGDIIGMFVSNIAVEIDAQTSVGDLSTDFRVQGTVTRSRLRGTINGGGPLLKLRTSAGDIRLQKR